MKALGLMSGTSMDGIDAAIIETDGERAHFFGPAETFPYAEGFKRRLAGGGEEVERELTLLHAQAVKTLLGQRKESVEIIGFHGHTVLHRPAGGVTRQIGDGALLAAETKIPVINDFRSQDVAAGGQGAPLAPLFHKAMALDLEKPLCVLNVGGVANVTYLGSSGEIIAFDTGPGVALIDDWAHKVMGEPMDKDGRLAISGTADKAAIARLLDLPYFDAPPPKSLDRNDFNINMISGFSPAEGAATLTAFTAYAVARSVKFLPAPPRRWLVCGGGRRNLALMNQLVKALKAEVNPVEDVGWNGDHLEAQAFAFLAVRSWKGLPLSLPTTTGVKNPTCGGVLHKV